MKNKKTSMIPIGFLAMIVVLILAFYDGNYYYNILCQICVYFIAVIGLNFTTGMTGQPMLGMAGVMGIGSYTTSILTTRYGFSPWATIPVVLLLGLVIGILLGYPSLRLSGVYLSFTTIGFSEIVRIIILNATDFTGGGTGIKNIPDYNIFGFEIATMRQKFILFMVISILIALLAKKIIDSQWGRYFFTIRDNVEAVPTCGINVTTVKVTAFILCTMLGSLSGCLYAHLNRSVFPTTYVQALSITLVSMLIIGGMGSIWGCLIGSAVVCMFPEWLRFLGRYYNFTYALIMLVLIVMMPGGLLNIFKKIDRKEKLRELTCIFLKGGK